MNSSFDFSKFSRQSSKGIFVIYINLIYRSIKLGWIFLFIIAKFFSKISNSKTVYIGVAFFLLLLLIRAYLLYKNFQFKIKDQHFILKQGIFKKTNTSIPFHRIQNINYKQNIIQQIINVFEVSIETAGSKDTEIAIKALSYKKAKALKEMITKEHIESNETLIKKEKKPFVKISTLELFKVSLTENHLKNLLIFFAVLLGFFQQIQQVVDGLGKTEMLDGYIAESSNALSTSLFFLFSLFFVLMIIAFFSSFVRIFLAHFNLMAILKNDAFEINQGLFTKKTIVLNKQKIQTLIISTNPLKKIIGISYITFKQAVSGEISDEKDKRIRIVGCKKEQVETIKNNLFELSELESIEKKFSNVYYKHRVLLVSFLFLIPFFIGMWFIFANIQIVYSAIVVFPIAIFLVLKKVKKRFYKISESNILVGKGLLETHLTYLEIFKVQNIKMKQTIFQKKSNVADIILQTASGKIKIPCLDIEEAIKIYNHTLYKVETSQFSWM